MPKVDILMVSCRSVPDTLADYVFIKQSNSNHDSAVDELISREGDLVASFEYEVQHLVELWTLAVRGGSPLDNLPIFVGIRVRASHFNFNIWLYLWGRVHDLHHFFENIIISFLFALIGVLVEETDADRHVFTSDYMHIQCCVLALLGLFSLLRFDDGLEATPCLEEILYQV